MSASDGKKMFYSVGGKTPSQPPERSSATDTKIAGSLNQDILLKIAYN